MPSFSSRRKYADAEIDPDEIFLDSQNLPQFDEQQFEGRIEKAIPKYTIGIVGSFCAFALLVLLWNVAILQVDKGSAFRERSENNRLKQIPFFSDRGAIYDRNRVDLAWNSPERTYTTQPGHSLLLGYVGYPTEAEIKQQGYNTQELSGKSGIEKVFNSDLRGESGLKIVETDASGAIRSESVYEAPTSGETVTLSIDSRIQSEFYEAIRSVAEDRGFSGGAGIIMDVETGELIALTSYPEYASNLFTEGDSAAITKAFNNPAKPFLNRATNGIYTPGSIIKPYLALGALTEKTMSPEKVIVSTGSISIPNPYDPKKSSVFKDWKALGAMNMRSAIAYSSDVYFYALGGGYKDQKGLGIRNIDKYLSMFGFGQLTGANVESEGKGVIPTPEWKAENFDGEAWLLGNTYHTSIGQYGFGSTPLQVVRAVAAIANRGKLLTPSILKQDKPSLTQNLPIADKDFTIIHEGMREAVTEGTAVGLNMPGISIAAKTGTAELGISKEQVNSWVTGFFPYEKPKYAFALVMEKGSRHNTIGGVFVARKLFEWMEANTPEYLHPELAQNTPHATSTIALKKTGR